jgi:PAS domain S-box-containing protein
MNIKKDTTTFPTIHKRIILVFILSSVFAILLVGSALNYALKKTTMDEWKKRQAFVTLEFAPQCDFEINEVKRNLEFLSKMPAFSSLPYIDQIDRSVNGIPENVDMDKRRILRELMALDKRFSSLVILRPNGDIYLVSPFRTQLKLKRTNFSDRAYFKEAFRTKRPVISDSFHSAAGNPVVTVAVPVLDKSGDITACIVGGVYLTDLSRLVSKDRIGGFDFGFIVDRRGNLIAHTDTGLVKKEQRERYMEHALVSRFLHESRSDESKVMIEDCVDPVDGKEYLSSFVKLKSGWGLGLAQSRKTILSEIRPVIWQITLLVSIIILVVSVAGVLFALWIGKRWATTEKALEKSESRFREMFEQSPFGIALIGSLKGSLYELNPKFAEICGRTVNEMIQTDWMRITHPDDVQEDLDNMALLNAGRIPSFNMDKRYIRPDGSPVWVNMTIAPVSVEDAAHPRHLCMVTDITEQKEAVEEKKQLQDKLQQSQKMEAVGTLAGGIAHDFNNILAVILGNAELAADDIPPGNPAGKSLKAIHQASIRAKDMVQQLLAFSRKSDEETKLLNMAPIVKESMKMLRTAVPSSIEFKQHISGDVCNILGDAAQISQIMMNLVTNAAHAMSQEGGLLEVTLEKIVLPEETPCFDFILSPGPHIRLKVRDTGKGIEPKILARIFDPYFTTKEVGKGTGMGLSVVHGIVKRHDGGILVESTLGEGTVFEIYFPALEKMVEEEKKPEGEIKGGSERILFVDDEESVVDLNHQRLTRLGYQVKSTTKPLEALEWFKADPDQFDVIITDMTMPHMTGDRLITEILAIRPQMPTIICTGYSERMSAKGAEALGARRYIEKPMGVRDLASALRDVLEEKDEP